MAGDALETESESLGKEVEGLSVRGGGMLSSTDFRKRIITEDVPRMKELFRRRAWGDIKPSKGFIIEPFNILNLTPYTYDLAIGDEIYSCRDRLSRTVGEAKESEYLLAPGETVIVRTNEYIALPPCYSAAVWPRFNFVREGIFQSMVKIDPTWYGQLGIALTNLSPAVYPIRKGKRFATLILYELTQDADIWLYREGELLQESKVISIDGMETLITEDKIAAEGLTGKCRIDGNKLSINVALTREEFIKVLRMNETREWKKRVEQANAIAVKTANSLGLPALDLLLAKRPDGELLSAESVSERKDECTVENLRREAVKQGKPFDLVANLPELMKKEVQGQVEQEFHKEIGQLILRNTAITVSLLGFISLVVAIIALVTRALQWELPGNIDWSETLVVAIIVVGTILAMTLSLMLLPGLRVKKISSLGKEIERFGSRYTKDIKATNDKLRNEIEKIWNKLQVLETAATDAAANADVNRDTDEDSS